MRHQRRALAWLLALCLLLAGCQRDTPDDDEPPPSPAPAAEPDELPTEGPRPISLDRLAVEVVVDWEDADRILSSLEDLSRLLEEALAALDCTVEEPVTVTIGTAGGITAQALGGGVDAAFLPLEDLAELEGAVQLLESGDRTLALAVAGSRADQRFCSLLPQALTETEAGQEFLETCYPGAGFTITYENGAGS